VIVRLHSLWKASAAIRGAAMVGVGGIQLGWMLVLGAIMFIEKAVTWGRWITMLNGSRE
jgi:predicted metal-binding membrane protein